MSSKINTVDEYIIHLSIWKEEIMLLREIVLSTGLTETIKWGAPCYQWQEDNVVGIAAFKSYTGLWFFQGGLLQDKQKFLMNAQEGKTKAMRQWRFGSKNDILQAPICEYVYESIENFKSGKKIGSVAKVKEIVIPELLLAALHADDVLKGKWNIFSTSCQREFAEYIAEAKKEDTRQNRLQKVIAMVYEGKDLNSKYKK